MTPPPPSPPRRGRRLRRIALAAAVACLAAYGTAVGMLYREQRALVFPADPRPVTAAEAGLPDTQDVAIRADDGVRLVGFYRVAEPGHATVIYFFGQAGSLRNRAQRLRLLSADGTGVLIVAYRGYSGSGGSPTEDNLHADAARVYRWLGEQGVDARRIVLYGESLGSGVAVQLAAEHPIAGVVLDGSYDAITTVASYRYPLVPVSWLMLDTFRSIDWIARLKGPLLMLHGDHDAVVPIAFAQRLFAEAPEPKRFDVIAGGNHSENLERRLSEVRGFIAQVTGSAVPADAPRP